MHRNRKPVGQVPAVGEEDCVGAVPARKTDVCVDVVFAVMNPEQHRYRRSGPRQLEDRQRALHDHDPGAICRQLRPISSAVEGDDLDPGALERRAEVPCRAGGGEAGRNCDGYARVTPRGRLRRRPGRPVEMVVEGGSGRCRAPSHVVGGEPGEISTRRDAPARIEDHGRVSGGEVGVGAPGRVDDLGARPHDGSAETAIGEAASGARRHGAIEQPPNEAPTAGDGDDCDVCDRQHGTPGVHHGHGVAGGAKRSGESECLGKRCHVGPRYDGDQHRRRW